MLNENFVKYIDGQLDVVNNKLSDLAVSTHIKHPTVFTLHKTCEKYALIQVQRQLEYLLRNKEEFSENYEVELAQEAFKSYLNNSETLAHNVLASTEQNFPHKVNYEAAKYQLKMYRKYLPDPYQSVLVSINF